MAKQLVCDKCGKVIGNNRRYYSAYFKYQKTERSENGIITKYYSDQSMDLDCDLCEDCADEVFLLIGGKVEDEQSVGD